MKRYLYRKAFTLAEILVALTIIGVVAALTIPGLINSYNNQVTISRLKEGLSILSQATRKMAFDNGGGLAGTFNTAVDIKNNYKQYLSYTKECDMTDGVCWPSNTYWVDKVTPVGTNWPWSPSILLNNGFIISIEATGNPSCTSDASGESLKNNVCYVIDLGINGLKGNIVGKDIFRFWVVDNGNILPWGTQGQDYYILSNCTSTGAGSGNTCAAMYLQQ